MRQVAYALAASCALMLGALTSASAGCYGECNGYRDYRSAPPYERYERPAYRPYDDSGYREPAYRESSYYDDGPRYHTTYYVRGPEYQVGGYYGDGYYDGYRRHRHYSGCGYYDCGYRGYGYRGYGYRYGYGYDYPTVRYGGAWSQTGPAYAWNGYGGGYYGYGCRTAYIPYGWTWYRSSSC